MAASKVSKLIQRLLQVTVLLCIWNIAHCELFTALVELEKVLQAENEVATDLRDYISREEQRLEQLKQLAADYETHSRGALDNPEKHLSNPVNAFLLVKRFTTDWDHVVASLIRSNNSEALLGVVSGKTSLFPDEEDLKGAATALLRLQDTYALSANRIAAGDIQGVKESPVMTEHDCFELGRLAYSNQDYYHTILWMEQALSVMPENATLELTIMDYLAFSYYSQGNIEKALELTIRWLALEPDHIRAQNNKKYYEETLGADALAQKRGDPGEVGSVQQKKPTFENKRQLDSYRQGSEFASYEALCRGEDVVPNPNAHKLTCQYRQHHPIFYINPLREEVMYLDPRIVIYHQVMTDKEIARIKELAQPRLHRAVARNAATGKYEPADYRISKSGWLKDEECPLIARVSQRSGALSNLTIETVEELQVVNYGIGGHYEPHYDFARKEESGSFEDKIGNRIATVIYYMTDVEAGGATVFPTIGVKLWPEKGSCAVWYNLMQSGEGDYRTRHAGCPVLTGNKWVCNKWFHERGQEFIRPCDLNPAK